MAFLSYTYLSTTRYIPGKVMSISHISVEWFTVKVVRSYIHCKPRNFDIGHIFSII
jgi:hypothetical protein